MFSAISNNFIKIIFNNFSMIYNLAQCFKRIKILLVTIVLGHFHDDILAVFPRNFSTFLLLHLLAMLLWFLPAFLDGL